MQSFESLVTHYGLVALFLGCFLEGESVAIAGGVLAHRGLLGFGDVALVVMAGAWTSDQFFFWIGRRYQQHPIVVRLAARRGVSHVLGTVALRPLWVSLVFRFIPGMRILAPLALAQSAVRWIPYAAVTAVTACIWGLIYTGMGNAVGTLIARLYGQRHRIDVLILAVTVILLVTVLFTVWRIALRRGD